MEGEGMEDGVSEVDDCRRVGRMLEGMMEGTTEGMKVGVVM